MNKALFPSPGTDPLGVKTDYKQMRYPLEAARSMASLFFSMLPKECYDKALLCGSVRRERYDIGDLDFVLVPTPHLETALKVMEKEGAIRPMVKKDGKVMLGKSLKSYILTLGGNPIQVDLYMARPDTFGINCFIRTGSKEHNIRIASTAKRTGYHLHPTGGLLKDTLRVDDDTDDRSIFKVLGLPYLVPEKRDLGNW